jgi:hypothetical protein
MLKLAVFSPSNRLTLRTTLLCEKKTTNKKRKLSLPVGRGTPKPQWHKQQGLTHSFACRCFLMKGCLGKQSIVVAKDNQFLVFHQTTIFSNIEQT